MWTDNELNERFVSGKKSLKQTFMQVISGEMYLILFTVSKQGLDTDDSTPQSIPE
jgi:hypothetical protein